MPLYKSLQNHPLLLDTHVWLWLMLGDERLNLSFRRTVEQHREKEFILVSAISVWELGMLVERERIELEIDCLDWVEQAFFSSIFELIPLTPHIAIQSTRLPEIPHGDQLIAFSLQQLMSITPFSSPMIKKFWIMVRANLLEFMILVSKKCIFLPKFFYFQFRGLAWKMSLPYLALICRVFFMEQHGKEIEQLN